MNNSSEELQHCLSFEFAGNLRRLFRVLLFSFSGFEENIIIINISFSLSDCESWNRLKPLILCEKAL